MTLIRSTLELVKTKLSESLRTEGVTNEDWALLSNLTDQEGQLYEETKHKIVIVLVNIQHETIVSTYNRTVPAKGDQYAVIAPPLYIDLFVLLYANFYNQSYRDGLGMISRTISFFQQNPWFTHDNLPGLDPVIDKLTFEMVNLSLPDLNYLMGMLGVKYLPCVYYKVRLLPFQTNAMQAEVPAAKGVTTPGEI